MSDCGCCDGIEIATPAVICNAPGLAALVYRVGTYTTFYETMLARLSNAFLDVPSANGTGTDRLYPLRALTARDASDPAIALLDGWALICDVLTFYQERIANEGYLPTAIERRSILELARLVGYRMRPGVAASVYLAFTAAQGFEGEFPAGTRAQSIPGTGELPQFFETSDALEVRDQWNAMKPRLTRPQFISPPAQDTPGVTDADMIDTIYFDGVATNLKSGDTLLILARGTPCLRLVQSLDVQADEGRTEALLMATGFGAADFSAMLDFQVAKATYLFPGNTIAQDVGAILSTMAANLAASIAAYLKKAANTANSTGGTVDLAALAKLAFAQIRERQAMAEARGFTRLSAWIGHVQEFLSRVAGTSSGILLEGFRRYETMTVTAPAFSYASSQAGSALGNLVTLSQSLARAPSLQPLNAVSLKRDTSQLFAPQSDTAVKMMKAFTPAYAATKIYSAWGKVASFGDTTDVYAMRVKAGLFANRDPGVTVNAAGLPTFTPPTIARTWKPYVKDHTPPQQLLLDAAYDHIALASLIAIDRPVLDTSKPDNPPTGGRAISFHRVTGKTTAMMSAGDGYQGNITFLALDPPWLGDLAPADIDAIQGSNAVLTTTVVYAQAEELALAEEPLDTDVSGGTISLDGVYDGLEPGRWIVVSGDRIDVGAVSDVPTSELAMIGGVLQGAEAVLSVDFPAPPKPPFASVAYVTAANDRGERLVVGAVSKIGTLTTFLNTLKDPKVLGQQFTDQIELAPGYYVNALVPTANEKTNGAFPDFAGALINPNTGLPFDGGTIPMDGTTDVGETFYYAWRISAQKTHTILKLASPLAYSYDTASVTVTGNVAKATHGQTTGELLGDGDASQRFQRFTLRQPPLTYVSAPNVSGAASTLKITVNDITWHERDDLLEEGPRDRTFITSESDDGKTTVIFGDGRRGARVPTGTANIKASYRYGIGAVGNVAANQISQMASHPLGSQGVINPLAATGGADADSADMGRRNAPLAVMALDRLVSVKDYADYSRTYAGVSKAVAAQLSDGRRSVVHVTIAGAGDIPIDVNSDLYNNLLQSLATYGDPYQPVQIGVRKARLLVISMNVALLPDYQWDSVAPKIRAAVLSAFAFDARDLGQPAFLSEAVRVVQETGGVSYCDPRIFDSVGEDVTAEELASLAKNLKLRQAVSARLATPDPLASDPGLRIRPAELVFLTPDIADTLILNEIGG